MDKGSSRAVAYAADDRSGSAWRALGYLWLLAAVCLLAAGRAEAGELHVLINGKAIHFDKRAGTRYNESNWGAGFQYDWSESAAGWVPFVSVSGFSDSNENPSYYAGGGMLRRHHFGGAAAGWHADVGFIAFLMKREGFKDGDPFPGVLPAFSFGTDRFALNVTYVPRVDPKAVPLVFFQLKLRLADF